MDFPVDPFARPADELTGTEGRILAAAFSFLSLSMESQGRIVPIVVGRPVLLSANDKSDVLLVYFQTQGAPSIITGLIGSNSRCSLPVQLLWSDEPQCQMLLAGEQLWFVPLTIVGAASLNVSEVTP